MGAARKNKQVRPQLRDKAEVPAAPAANRNGSSGKQQLDAAITLPSAARLATTVLLDPDLLVAWFSSI